MVKLTFAFGFISALALSLLKLKMNEELEAFVFGAENDNEIEYEDVHNILAVENAEMLFWKSRSISSKYENSTDYSISVGGMFNKSYQRTL